MSWMPTGIYGARVGGLRECNVAWNCRGDISTDSWVWYHIGRGRRSRTAGISVIMCLSSRGVKKLVVEWGAKLELGPPRAWGMVVHV